MSKVVTDLLTNPPSPGMRVNVFGTLGVVTGPATPHEGKPRWLVRWDSDGSETEVMQSNLRPLDPQAGHTPSEKCIEQRADELLDYLRGGFETGKQAVMKFAAFVRDDERRRMGQAMHRHADGTATSCENTERHIARLTELLGEANDTIETLRAQYDRHVARHIDEKRALRRELATSDALVTAVCQRAEHSLCLAINCTCSCHPENRADTPKPGAGRWIMAGCEHCDADLGPCEQHEDGPRKFKVRWEQGDPTERGTQAWFLQQFYEIRSSLEGDKSLPASDTFADAVRTALRSRKDLVTLLTAVVAKAGGEVALTDRNLIDVHGMKLDCYIDMAMGGRTYRAVKREKRTK